MKGLFLAAAIVLVAMGVLSAKQSVSDGDYERALKKLKTLPDDPDANSVVGKYLAFVRGDWDAAGPFLMKGKDKLIRELLAIEAALGQTAYDRVEMGDKWLKAAEAAGTMKPYFKDRSLQWYGRGWEQGLDDFWKDTLRAKLEKTQSSGGAAFSSGAAKNWTMWGGAGIGQKYAHSGRRSAALSQRMNKNKSASNTQAEGKWIPIPAALRGKGFMLSFWALSDNTEAGGDNVQFQVADPINNVIDQVIPIATDQPYWKKIRVAVGDSCGSRKV